MFRNKLRTIGLTVIIAVLALSTVQAQQGIVRDYDDRDNYDPDRVKVDRYLTTEVWTNHEDGEYFEGDNIVINFLTNRDAFVIIYSVDTRGRLNLLFPTSAKEDNFVEGGQVYRLPGGNDDFDLVVNGPEGVESIQVIASRERLPVPDWYPQSGLSDEDWDDRHDFMDYINSRYFARYDGQRFAFDRASIYVNEWEPDYYQPVYYPDYPSWTVTGNVYIDYPYGGTVYINGVYWGVAPLYVPRIYVGWHTLTIYDRYGYCWENDFHVTRYNTLVLDRNIIRPRVKVLSRYSEVNRTGYRNPIKHGYPTYKTKNVTKVNTSKVSPSSKTTVKSTTIANKKFLRGTSSKVVKTDRGYETKGTGISSSKKGTSSSNSKSSSSQKIKSSSRSKSTSSGSYKSSGKSKSSSGKSSSVYKRKSGSSISKSKAGKSSSSGKVKKSSTKSKSSSAGKSSGKSKSSSSSKVEQKKSPAPKSSTSGKSTSKSSSKTKSSGGKKKN